TVYTKALEDLLGPARKPGEELTQRHKDLAASLQKVYEDRFFALVRALQKRTGMKSLALAGGCAMNSLANGRLFERTDVRDVYIQSAAGDAGTSLGAALYVHHAVFGAPRNGFVMEHSYWGPAYGEEEVRRAIAAAVLPSEVRIETVRDEERLADETAEAIARGDVVGWYQGRSEWGPRALGNRSILADPRRGDMKDILNLKIKRRESFRPFAPSILEERTGDWFTISYPDPFMIKVYPIRPERRPEIPAVTHVDGTGRLQTVSKRANPRYWKLISAFERRTGVPLVLNTSFNENEPIVNTPAEALDCFLRTRMDRLVLGDVVLARG
ncbi:MAG TPA: carbamoyltransferase C-terminal domain-containing protein, partial [Thermoanaerobaculia bacterium]|nr:carbamoyltransferase C-terminal domain-containing protein [Thermoanaerobaculia bacterium]